MSSLINSITCLRLTSIDDKQFDNEFIDAIHLDGLVVICVETKKFLHKTGDFYRMLSNEEIDLANRKQLTILKNKYLIHRGILRWLIAQAMDTLPSHVEFSYGPKGKPFIKDNSIFFNLSHSENWALYAFSQYSLVGIDVEEKRQNLDLEQLALLVLSPGELEFFNSIDKNEQQQAFFRLWTMKEAFSKCHGMGLNMDFTQIDFGRENLDSWQKCSDTLVFDISQGSNYFASLAVSP